MEPNALHEKIWECVRPNLELVCFVLLVRALELTEVEHDVGLNYGAGDDLVLFSEQRNGGRSRGGGRCAYRLGG